MPLFNRTKKASDDLVAIWHYSADRWGAPQADRYIASIHTACSKIAHSELVIKKTIGHHHLCMVRVQHHYIIYLPGEVPLIIRILHEKMDFITRLKSYLDTNPSHSKP